MALVRPMLRCLRDDLNMLIRAIDDIVLLKVKVGRWRGAVYRDDAAEAEVPAWLVAAGLLDEDA